MEKKSLDRHRSYLSQTALLAEELGYNIELLNLENAPGSDMILRNPQNNRKAYVELEVTFQQQIGHQRKVFKRWQQIQNGMTKGEDAILLVIGARRRDLISLCKRAGIPDPEQEYGKRLFSCVSYSDQNEIRVALLRCLGGD